MAIRIAAVTDKNTVSATFHTALSRRVSLKAIANMASGMPYAITINSKLPKSIECVVKNVANHIRCAVVKAIDKHKTAAL